MCSCFTILRGMLLLLNFLCISGKGCGCDMERSGSCQLGIKRCLPIRFGNGEMLHTIPKPMDPFLLPVPGNNQHFVCGLSHCDSNPCDNGKCEETAEGYHCHCLTGFKGTHCDESENNMTKTMKIIQYDTDCDSNPCDNGKCEETTEGYQCHCLTGFKGTHCDESENNKTQTMKIVHYDNELTAKIFVALETTGELFVADLQDELVFTTFSASPEPRAITYDSKERKIYWCDITEYQVYRADINGANRQMAVVLENKSDKKRLAIAEKARILYISYYLLGKITSASSAASDSDTRGTESDFVTNLKNPKSLVVDEEQGYLYWTMKCTIARTFLNGTGSTDVLHYNRTMLNYFTGLSIDLTKSVRRIFVCSWGQQRTFYMDVSTSPNADTFKVHELTKYFKDTDSEGLTDVVYFNGVLYWTKWGNRTGITMMKDYEHANRTYSFQEVLLFNNTRPDKMRIAYVEP